MKFSTGTLLFFLTLGVFSTNGTAEELASYQVDAIADGRLAKAEQELLAVLEKNPEDPFALLNLAYVYQKAGDPSRAQEIYERILSQKDNPYAELVSGKYERVKTIAKRGMVQSGTGE